jgi:hypothetical protein
VYSEELPVYVPPKGLTMTTEPPPDPIVVWVTVAKVQQPRTQWTYLLSENDPSGPRSDPILRQGIPTDKLCYSYTELRAWLLTYGFTPPPPDYFAPTPEELAERAEWVVRPVTRSR